MAWIAVDRDGRVFVYEIEPIRGCDEWFSPGYKAEWLHTYAAKLLTGRELTWDDEPVEIKTL